MASKTNKISQSIILGIAGSLVMNLAFVVMAVFAFIFPILNSSKFNPAYLISGLLGFSISMGYIIHLLVGIIFAFTYIYFFNHRLRSIGNQLVKGAIFGIIVFAFTQTMLFLVHTFIRSVPFPSGNIVLILLANMIAHIFYGITIALFSKSLSSNI